MKPLSQTVRGSQRTLVCAALFTIALASPGITAAQNNSPTPTEQEQLIKAQTANYVAQTARINEERSSWHKVLSFGGFFAAVVAVMSLVLNFTSTIRTQRDGQFLEALKRFGDKDSPTVRSSAAGLLAKLSNQKGILLWWKRPNFDIALDQLMAGSLLEENPVCLTSIRDALRHLCILVPVKAIEKIRQANLGVQKEMIESLATFLATKPPDEDTGQPSAEDWNDAAASTPYMVGVLSNLVDRHCKPPFSTRTSDIFSMVFKTALHEYGTLDPEKKSEYATAAQKAVLQAGERLNLNVEIFATMLRTDPFRKIPLDLSGYPATTAPARTLESVFLVRGNLSSARLQGINLQHAQLEDTDLSRADLRAALLPKTSLQGANLEGANLQKAWMVAAELGAPESFFKTSLENADLEDANLSGADLVGVSAKGANLKGTRLDNTQLYELEINGSTNLEGSDWWKANFETGEEIDIPLLAQLFDRYEHLVPESNDEFHPCVNKFLEKLPRERFNQERITEYLASKEI